MRASERTLTLPGGTLVGTREGGDPSGRVLLWFHGGLSSGGEVEFLHSAARLHGVRVVALERPGIGQSSLWDLASVSRWPEVVTACAEQLGLERFSVAGWSAGGPYALACAWKLADRLDSVTIVAGMYPITDLKRRRELGILGDRILFSLSRRHPGLARAVLEPYRWLPQAVLWQMSRVSVGKAEKDALTPAVRTAFVAILHGAVRNGVGGVVEDYRRLGGDWGVSLDDIAAPVTLLQGTHDGMVPLEHAELLSGELRAATLCTLPGAGHFLPITHAEEIIRSSEGGNSQA